MEQPVLCKNENMITIIVYPKLFYNSFYKFLTTEPNDLL